MKIDAKRSDDLSRVAMVADQAWIKWGASAADLATGAKLKWFDTSERDAAIAWARDG
ncbi:STAS/SEC14 domain-containing protein [Fulvimarina manganoxydans]|nr:STAS/SEC14 domain-containing protein [Fulvimarina manganoxydans]